MVQQELTWDSPTWRAYLFSVEAQFQQGKGMRGFPLTFWVPQLSAGLDGDGIYFPYVIRDRRGLSVREAAQGKGASLLH